MMKKVSSSKFQVRRPELNTESKLGHSVVYGKDRKKAVILCRPIYGTDRYIKTKLALATGRVGAKANLKDGICVSVG
jgi:hypothetical protein